MSQAATPRRPPPDTAWKVVTVTLRGEKAMSGFNANASPATTQLGLVTMNPGCCRSWRDQPQVPGVHLRDEQRHVGVHAAGAGVGKDEAAAGTELGFQLAGDGGGQGREHDARTAARSPPPPWFPR